MLNPQFVAVFLLPFKKLIKAAKNLKNAANKELRFRYLVYQSISTGKSIMGAFFAAISIILS